MKAKINGIQMGYEVSGEAGLPIVLIHGLGLNRSIWKELVNEHLHGYHVILPDVRGHGESQATAGVYSMTGLAEDMVALLDFLNIEKAIICGHSMGGYIALAFAQKFPERLAGLGLITTHAAADSAAKRADRYQMVEDVRKEGARVLAESLAPRLTEDEAIMQQTHQILLKTDPVGIMGVSQGMAERPARVDLLPEIDVPALVVAGREDQIIDIDTARKMAESLPHGKFMLIEGAGHMPMIEAPGTLGEGLIWLHSQVGAQKN